MSEDRKVRWFCRSDIGELPQIAQTAEWENERLIWGAEVLVVDEDQHSSKASLIVKSDEGRRNLYSLLTEGGREESDPTVKVSCDLLEKYRAGLLVGAAWGGEIMSTAIRGEDENTLAKLLEHYDFVELNPMDSNEMRTVELPEIERVKRAALKADTICVRSPEDFKALCEPTPVIEETKAPDIYSGGQNLIKGLCEGALAARFPNGAPQVVEERMEEELGIICRNGYFDSFFVAKEVADAVKGNGYPLSTTGEIGASYVAYLLGITDIDPLHPHDLDDSYILPWEMVFGVDGSRIPSITLKIPSMLRDKVFKLLKSRHENVFYTTRADWEDDNVDHIVILPDIEWVDTNQYTPLQQAEEKDMDDALTSPFEYVWLDNVLMVQTTYSNSLLDELYNYEQTTGVSSKDISMDDPKVLEYFNEKKADDSPDFNKVLSLIGETSPKSFRHLVDILGKSMATWRFSSQKYAKPFCCREDILNVLMDSGLSREKAFSVMTRVRKGKGLNDEMKEWVEEAGVPNTFAFAMENVDYIFPRAHIIEIAKVVCQLAYYKAHYKDII